MALAVSVAVGAARAAWPQADYGEADQLYAALAKQPHTRLTIGGGVIDVVFADGADGLNRAQVLDWIRTSATAVTTYFGRFPVSHLGLLVIADNGDKIGSAHDLRILEARRSVSMWVAPPATRPSARTGSWSTK